MAVRRKPSTIVGSVLAVVLLFIINTTLLYFVSGNGSPNPKTLLQRMDVYCMEGFIGKGNWLIRDPQPATRYLYSPFMPLLDDYFFVENLDCNSGVRKSLYSASLFAVRRGWWVFWVMMNDKALRKRKGARSGVSLPRADQYSRKAKRNSTSCLLFFYTGTYLLKFKFVYLFSRLPSFRARGLLACPHVNSQQLQLYACIGCSTELWPPGEATTCAGASLDWFTSIFLWYNFTSKSGFYFILPTRE